MKFAHSMLKVAAIVVLFLVFSSTSLVAPVQTWMTSGDQAYVMKRVQDQAFNVTGLPTAGTQIVLQESTLYQTIDGIGAAFSESAVYLLMKLKNANSTVYWKTMNRIFGKESVTGDPWSVGYNIMRVTASASDFSLNSYTYDDTPGDTSLSQFSIARDKLYMIPVIKDALSINPNIKLMLSAWSMPTWMKSSNAWSYGTLLASMYDVYANFWVKAVQAYQAEGIQIYAMTLQNEPMYEPKSGGQNYPGMKLEWTQEAEIGIRLGKAFQAANITTKILALDHNWDMTWYAQPLLSNATVRQYINGIAWHCYAGDVSGQTTIHNAFPDMETHFTECTAYGQYPNWSGDIQYVGTNQVVNTINNWSRSVIQWNLALDTNFGPQNGGCDKCRGMITIDQNNLANVQWMGEYFALGHFSKFLTVGTKRMGMTKTGGTCINAVAFKNSDGSSHIGLVNNCGWTDVAIQLNGMSVYHWIPNGITTFAWNLPTTQTVTTKSVTTQAVTTNPVTTRPVTTSPVTTSAVTTSAVTTFPVTTAAVSTQAVSTFAVTTVGVTTQAVTTSAVTTEAVTTSPVTTQAVTTEGVTTAPVTTAAASTAAVSTEAVSTGAVSTAGMTTEAVVIATTGGVSTGEADVTTSAPTTGLVSSDEPSTSNATGGTSGAAPVTTGEPPVSGQGQDVTTGESAGATGAGVSSTGAIFTTGLNGTSSSSYTGASHEESGNTVSGAAAAVTCATLVLVAVFFSF